MQQTRDVLDDLKADECRQQEHERHGPQIKHRHWPPSSQESGSVLFGRPAAQASNRYFAVRSSLFAVRKSPPEQQGATVDRREPRRALAGAGGGGPAARKKKKKWKREKGNR